MESHIPAKSIQRGVAVESIERNGGGWSVRGTSIQEKTNQAQETFDAVLVATPAATTAKLLRPLDSRIEELLPQQSSSAIVVALGFTAGQAQAMRIPCGFGFLVSQTGSRGSKVPAVGDDAFGGSSEAIAQRALLACTFVNQKFPHRAPGGAVLLRTFFGGPAALTMLQQSDDTLTRFACAELGHFLGKLPEPSISLVRRWPNSLPLYPVGHLDRMTELDVRVSQLPNLRLIGNAYRGVGLPDLIHSGRTVAREHRRLGLRL
jgi:oxygen-dependent protoporphyrinogen oxidase